MKRNHLISSVAALAFVSQTICMVPAIAADNAASERSMDDFRKKTPPKKGSVSNVVPPVQTPSLEKTASAIGKPDVARDQMPQEASIPFTEQQFTIIQDLVVKTIENNPWVIEEAIVTLKKNKDMQRQKQISEAIQGNAKFLFENQIDPVVGNPAGPVRIAEFFDYQCGFCKQSDPEIKKAVDANHDLKVVLKHLPVLGEISDLAARVAISAQKQGKFPAFHTLLMTSTEKLTEDVIFEAAKKTGLDIDQVKNDVKSPETNNVLEQNRAAAKGFGISATPAFVIGDTVQAGFLSEKDLQEKIKGLSGDQR